MSFAPEHFSQKYSKVEKLTEKKCKILYEIFCEFIVNSEVIFCKYQSQISSNHTNNTYTSYNQTINRNGKWNMNQNKKNQDEN